MISHSTIVLEMKHALTFQENIALDIIFELLGESYVNREIDDWGTTYKYIFIASRAPKLTVMHDDINKVLVEMAARGFAPFETCSFKRGDRYYHYEKFPISISKETIRKAWIKSGMRDLQLQYRRQAKFKRTH
jgi:hypothetical protein